MMRAFPVFAISVVLLAACGGKKEGTTAQVAHEAVAAPAELQKIDIRKGTGEGISQGQVAVVHYTGWLYDPTATEQKGAKFDSSRDSGVPFSFTIGHGDVIRGWDEGVQGMQPGGQRRLVIPPALGYGELGAQNVIPPKATLVFEIELLEIQEPK
jgi:FKBP-type peptidyl-prolyl cis-trans isomerase FkpA